MISCVIKYLRWIYNFVIIIVIVIIVCRWKKREEKEAESRVLVTHK